MGAGTSANSASAPRNFGAESEHSQILRDGKACAGTKPRNRRRAPISDAVRPIDLLLVALDHFFPEFAKDPGKLKELFPRLSMRITGDSLYACSSAIDVCERMHWSYMLIFKEGRTPALWQRALKKAEKGRSVQNRLPGGTEQTFRWATMLEHEEHTVHAVICRLAQVAHLLLQLMSNGDLVRKLAKGASDTFPDAFRSLRNFAARMRESIQRDPPDSSLRGNYAARIQIRFVAPP